MNQIGARVHINNDEDRRMVEAVKTGQTDEKVYEVYNALKNHRLVRWKDSFKKTLLDNYKITV